MTEAELLLRNLFCDHFAAVRSYFADHVLQIHFICGMVFTKPDKIQMRNCVTLASCIKSRNFQVPQKTEIS